jgi:predicted peptidase
VCACATSPSSTRAARAPSPQAAAGFQSARVFTDPAAGDVRYLLYLPRASEESPDRRPLILFLHGDGERGDDLELVKREGLPKILEHNRDFPFAVVSPQCPRRRHWSVEVLDRLLTDVTGRFRVDPDRIYATGLSSGAVASLELAALRPGRLAAVAAVASNREPRELCRVAAVPVWLFHNADDERVSAGLSRRLARRLRDCGGTARLTIFPRSGHDAWSEAYFRADLYDWFLRNRRPSGRPMMN